MATLEVKNLVLTRKKNISMTKTVDNVVILKGINAEFKSGAVNAIMAPNGSGKTTFLNAIFAKSDSDIKTSGQILYEGKERDPQRWFNEVSFVEQSGFQFIDQTVENVIKFSIEIKNSQGNENISMANLKEIINALHLEHILTKNVNSISGGELKRVMIAIELIMKKKILILDEPTSDLDSHLAYKLISFLKQKAIENDTIVILSIHQPSDQIFKIFDRITFILEGKLIFSGIASELLPFFESYKIFKPESWTVSDFVFEAFYNQSTFKEINQLKSHIDHMISDSVIKSDLILSAANPTAKHQKSIFDWTLNINKISILFKRFMLVNFTKRSFYFGLATILPIIFLINSFILSITYKLDYSIYVVNFPNAEDITFAAGTSVKDVLNNSDLLKSDADRAFRDYLNFRISSDFRSSLISSGLYSLFCNTGIFSMRDQLRNEVCKGFYNSFTLFTSALLYEVFFGMMVASLVCFSLLFNSSYKLLSLSAYPGIFISFGLCSFTRVLFSILRLFASSFGLVSSFIFILKFGNLFSITFSSFAVLITLKNEVLGIAFRITLSILTTFIYPSFFLFYIFGYIYSFIDEKKLINHTNMNESFTENTFQAIRQSLDKIYVSLFTEKEIDYRWAILLFLVSTASTLIISALACSRIFNPRISIKV